MKDLTPLLGPMFALAIAFGYFGLLEWRFPRTQEAVDLSADETTARIDALQKAVKDLKTQVEEGTCTH